MSELADQLAQIPTTKVEIPENPIVPASVTTMVWISAEMRDEIAETLRDLQDEFDNVTLPLVAWCNDPTVSDTEYRFRARRLMLRRVADLIEGRRDES